MYCACSFVSSMTCAPRAGRCRRATFSSSAFGNRCTSAAYPASPVCSSICAMTRSEEHTSELQSRENLVCRLLLEKKKARRAPAFPVLSLLLLFFLIRTAPHDTPPLSLHTLFRSPAPS